MNASFARAVSFSPLGKGSALVTGPYDIPLARVRARALLTASVILLVFGGVGGVQHLEPHAGQVRQHRQEPAADDLAGQQRAREQPALLGRCLALEDESRSDPDDAHIGVPFLQVVEDRFDPGLLPRIARRGETAGRPGLVDRSVLGAGGVGTDRGGIDERGHAGSRGAFGCKLHRVPVDNRHRIVRHDQRGRRERAVN